MTRAKGMFNAFFPGATPISKAITRREGTEIYTPVDADFSIVVQIESYDEGSGLITGIPVWDLKGTRRVFSLAKFAGREGIPLAENVNPGEFVVCHRVGAAQNQPSDFSGFALQSENSTKPSYVSFFFENAEICEPLEIPALLKGPTTVEKNTPVTGQFCSPYETSGQIFELQGFEVVLGNITAFEIGGIRSDFTDGLPILIDEDTNIVGNIDSRIDCETLNDAEKFYPVTLGYANVDGNAAYLVVSQGQYTIGATCCQDEEPDPGGGDPPDPGGTPGVDFCFASATIQVFDQNVVLIEEDTIPLTQDFGPNAGCFYEFVEPGTPFTGFRRRLQGAFPQTGNVYEYTKFGRSNRARFENVLFARQVQFLGNNDPRGVYAVTVDRQSTNANFIVVTVG